MICSPFSHTLRTLSTVRSRVGLQSRRFFFPSNRTDARNPWNDELDSKILELRQQGLTIMQIAQQLGHGVSRVQGRIQTLRDKSKSEPASFSTGKDWTTSEDKVLMEKFEAGLKWKQMLPFLPGRSVEAARSRYYKLKRGDAGAARRAIGRKSWTAEEKQCVVSMMLVEGLSQKVTAERLGRTKVAVQRIWQSHGRNVLPADMVEKYRGENEWTSEQDDILIEQKKKGKTYEAIQLELPSKSVKAVAERARYLQITRVRLSPIRIAAIRKDLQAVLDGTATYEDVHNKYRPFAPPTSVKGIWKRLRQGFYKDQTASPTDTVAKTEEGRIDAGQKPH